MYVCVSSSVLLPFLHILYLYLNSEFCDSEQGRPDQVIPISLISFSVRVSVCIIEKVIGH